MHKYNTKILKPTDLNIEKVVTALKNQEIVAIPTETVYGLAANGLSEDAVEKIFLAKGRPQDNPLILHISEISHLDRLISHKPKITNKLIDLFWPGPLTLVFKKSSVVPNIVSSSLDTVAVRMPDHPVARKIITAAGFPLAAPSANTSGFPSPTTAKHVYDDLKGKIPYIIDGGNSEIGLESTVLSLVEETPKLLRPGKITIEELYSHIDNLEIDDSILGRLKDTEKPLSPGMKYKHYSPKASVKIFEGSCEDYGNYLLKLPPQKNVWALCFDEDIKYLTLPYLSYGKKDNYTELAHNFFHSLRRLDEKNAKTIIAHAPKKEGLGLSIYNRLLRSANFNIVTIGGD